MLVASAVGHGHEVEERFRHLGGNFIISTQFCFLAGLDILYFICSWNIDKASYYIRRVEVNEFYIR
jgi:hypothetical protein